SPDIKFINTCLELDITPKFVRKTVKNNDGSKEQKTVEKKILKMEKNKHFEII
ncbi:hypothetical protein L9F63_002006, partial [Diploptera punctata]